MADSFSKNSKAEVLAAPLKTRPERGAFLSGVVHTAGSVVISGTSIALVIAAADNALAAKTSGLISGLYNFDALVCGGKIELDGAAAKAVLEGAGILFNGGGAVYIRPGIDPGLVKTREAAAAYVKGAYAAAGSMSVKNGYRLEFALSNMTLASDLRGLLQSFGVTAKCVERADRAVLYIKDADSASDCLALMGAYKSVLELNNRYAERKVSQSANRVINCDLANIDKALAAAAEQAAAIGRLADAGLLDGLNGRLADAARLRLDYPEAGIAELAQKAGISKSGMKHRLDRLKNLADGI
ncbi:MAG: DNA-binding protein WhiA [Clostridiales bacterium]|jgi:DNA-binding protein WhiA|nr:DNA-binding protein WhiA [Clostridiales bacterium]